MHDSISTLRRITWSLKHQEGRQIEKGQGVGGGERIASLQETDLRTASSQHLTPARAALLFYIVCVKGAGQILFMYLFLWLI